MLGLLLLQPTREWTLEELAERLDAPVSSIHRELQRARDAGFVIRDSRQRPHLYRAAEDSPAFQPLSRLLEMTVGVPERLRRALAGVPGVHAAAIHGSWANQRVRPDSDLDVIVVSDGKRRDTQNAVRRVGREVGRQVDASVLTVDEFHQMRALGNPFLEKILRGARIDVVGDLANVRSSK